MKRKKQRYPGIEEAEKMKTGKDLKELSDMIGTKPNYDNFPNWEPAKVLKWLNID